ALERHANVGTLAPGQLDEPLPDAGVELDELGVARAPVVEHRFLDAARCRQRARRQQPGIASRLGHVSLPPRRACSPPLALDREAGGTVWRPPAASRREVVAGDLDLEARRIEICRVYASRAPDVAQRNGADDRVAVCGRRGGAHDGALA